MRLLSSQAIVSIPALKETNSILISPTASTNKIINGNHIISFFPSQIEIAEAITNYLISNNIKYINVVYSANKSYSKKMANSFKKTFNKSGGNIKNFIPVNSNFISLSKYADNLKNNKVRYIFIPMSDLNAAKTILELERLGVNNYIIGSDSWATYSDSIQLLINKLVTKRTVYASLPIMYSPNRKNKTNGIFVKLFKKKYSLYPTDMEAFSYDSLNLIAKLLSKCNINQVRYYLKKCLKISLPFKSTTGLIVNSNGLYLSRSIIIEHIVMGKNPNDK